MNPVEEYIDESTAGNESISNRENPVASFIAELSAAPAPQVKPDYWNEQLKPTLLDTGKQLFELPRSVGESIVSAGSGALGWLVGSGLGIAEATKPGATRESIGRAAETAAEKLSFQPATDPAKFLMNQLGFATNAVTGPAKEAAALVGESWDSPFLESVLKFAGEMATFEALGSAAKARPAVPNWYRRMTIKERGMVEGLKTDIANGEFTAAQVRELWKDPMNRAELLKRYQGVGKGEARPEGTPMKEAFIPPPQSGAVLPPGQGFNLRGTPYHPDAQAFLQSLVGRIALPEGAAPAPALPPGQGFGLQGEPYNPNAAMFLRNLTTPQLEMPKGMGDAFTFADAPVEAPLVTKSGKSFPNQETARKAGQALNIDWNLYEIVPREGGFAISRRQGKEFRQPNAPPDESTKIRKDIIDLEDTIRKNAHLQGTPMFKTWADALAGMKAKLPEGEQVPPAPLAQTSGTPGANAEKAGGALPPTQQESATAFPLPVPAKQPAATNLITRLQQGGGVKWGDDFNGKDMRQFPDGKRVSNNTTGTAPDEWAQILNDEGYLAPDGKPFTDDRLAQFIESGQARNIFTPDKSDAIISRRLEKEANDWYENQLASIESPENVRAEISTDQEHLKRSILDEVGSEGHYPAEKEADALKELEDFFSEISKPEINENAPAYQLKRMGEIDTPVGTIRSQAETEALEMPGTEPVFNLNEKLSEAIGPEPPSAPRDENHVAIIDAIPDKPWQWKAEELVETPLDRIDERLEKIWGPEEGYDDWQDGGGVDKKRYYALLDNAGELDRAVRERDIDVVKNILKDIHKRLEPQDYYAYEEQVEKIQKLSGRRPGISPVKDASGGEGKVPTPARASIASKDAETLRKETASLPGLSGAETFLLSRVPVKSKTYPKQKAETQQLLEKKQEYGKPLTNQRGSLPIDPAITEAVLKTREEVRSVWDDTKKTADEYLGAISTRLGNIDPSLRNTLRKFEFTRGMKVTEATKRALPFLEKAGKMTKADRVAFDLARKNGDPTALRALVIKYDMGKEYHELRNVLGEIYQAATDVGYDVGYQPNYHPRVLKDAKGFLEYFYKQKDWPILEKAIRAKEVELQRYLSQEEKAQLINGMLRGYPSGHISLAKPGQLKSREVETITPELNKFYMESDGALLRYISDVTDAIEARRLFGKGPKGGKIGNITDTIGGYVLDLLNKGKIKPEQEQPLRDILDARFNEVGTRGIFGLYKNLSYIDTMGSPISAITQIGDLAWALYKNGVGKTLSASGKSIAGKSEITKEDIGISRIASEFADTSKAARAVDKVFRVIGLEKLDNIGKEGLINSTYRRAVEKASADPAALKKELQPIFEGETDQLIKDLKAGNITENVKLYLFNTLSDFQPISLSEMPQKYLTGGNGRIFYMLKTFTLKQFDIFRREVFQQIGNKGTRVKGLKNLLALSAAFVAANAASDVIKDMILNRPMNVDDKVVDNLLRLFGVSKFVTWQAREQGIGSAMVRQIAPPFKAIDSISKDINTAGDEKGMELAQSIPVFGKLYYWWFGKGAGKSERQRNKADKSGMLIKETPGQSLQRLSSGLK